MEQDKLGVVLDPSEVITEHGDEAPAAAAVLAGELAGAEEGVSEVDGPVRVAALEGAKKQDLEELSPESGDEVAEASGGVESEDRGAFEDPDAACIEVRAAAAGVPVLVASSSSARAPVTGTHEDVPAMAHGDHGAASGDHKKLNERACYAPGATVAIAHASPPDSYRRAPSRSRKQHSPKRFVAAPGSAASDGAESCCASSSSSPGRRGRKQSRPEHFNPGEAKATVRAKARRTGIALDRFITSVLRGYSASDSESAKNITEAFGIRDASQHAARARGLRAAISRPGASFGGPFSSAAAAVAPGSPSAEPDGRGRFYGDLGASLAPDVVAVPSLEKQDK